jgi:hypothetical protein
LEEEEGEKGRGKLEATEEMKGGRSTRVSDWETSASAAWHTDMSCGIYRHKSLRHEGDH